MTLDHQCDVLFSPQPTSRPVADPTTLIYLYCILDADSPATRLLDGRHIPGIVPGNALRAVTAGALAAAVSDVPAELFVEESLDALARDLARLTPLAVRHEEAIRALMPAATALVPLTFGTVYRTVERVAAMLTTRAVEFDAMLGNVRGRQEFGLRVFVDSAALRSAADQSPAVRSLDADRATASPGRGYLLARKRDRIVASEVDRLLRENVNEILDCLDELATASLAEDVSDAPPEEPRLIARVSFLVDAARAEAFTQAGVALRLRFAPAGLIVDVTGPWAPYAFVRQDTTGRVDDAR